MIGSVATQRSSLSRHRRHDHGCLDAGIEVHIFEPDGATLDVMGINALDRRRSPRVHGGAFLAAGSHIADSEPLRKRLLGRHALA